MSQAFDSGGGGGGAPVISIGRGYSTPGTTGYVSTGPRSSSSSDVTPDIDELIAGAVSRGGYRNNPYLDNLNLIKASKPYTKAEKETQTDDQLGQILDVIGYASAIASVIPYPPVSIGGMLGFAAQNVARSYLPRSNAYARNTTLDQLYRTFNRVSRQYRAYSGSMGTTRRY
jgi:Ni/Co efflux regulator RcnB